MKPKGRSGTTNTGRDHKREVIIRTCMVALAACSTERTQEVGGALTQSANALDVLHAQQSRFVLKYDIPTTPEVNLAGTDAQSVCSAPVDERLRQAGNT